MRANFGPTFIVKYDIQDRVTPISELQPMNPEDRMVRYLIFIMSDTVLNGYVITLGT